MNKSLQLDRNAPGLLAGSESLPPIRVDRMAGYREFFDKTVGEVGELGVVNGITLRLPSLTGHPGLPQSGRLYGYVNIADEYGQFESEFEDGIIEFEPLFIAPDIAGRLRGQTMIMQYSVQGEGLPVVNSYKSYCDLAPSTFTIEVVQAPDNLIDAQAAAQGVTLSIAPAVAIQAQDRLTVHVVGEVNNTTFLHRVTVGDAQQPSLVHLPPEQLLPNGNGRILVFYTIDRQGQRTHGPLATYRIQGRMAPIEILGGVWREPHVQATAVYGQPVTLTQPVPPASAMAALQVILVTDMDDLSRRGYELHTRKVDALTDFTVDLPADGTRRLRVVGWVETAEGRVEACVAESVQLLIERSDEAASRDLDVARERMEPSVPLLEQVGAEHVEAASARRLYPLASGYAAVEIVGFPVEGAQWPRIPAAVARQGLSLVLPLSAEQALGQVITFYGAGAGYGGCFVTPVELTQQHLDQGFLQHDVGPELLSPHEGGPLTITYTVLVLGRDIVGPTSRFYIQSMVNALQLNVATTRVASRWEFNGQPVIQWAPYPWLAAGDRVVAFADPGYDAAISHTAWRQEQVIVDPHQPVVVQLPADFIGRDQRIVFSLFVIEAASGRVSCVSQYLERLGRRGEYS